MGKRIALILVVALVMQLAPAMAVSAEEQTDSSSSLQMMFASMQLELAETAKSQAASHMEAVTQLQAEAQKVSGFLASARSLRTQAQNGQGSGDDVYRTQMPGDMVSYISGCGLACPQGSGDHWLNSSEWTAVISSLNGRLETISAEVQQEMAYAQDFLQQYNSYLQSAGTQISNSNQYLVGISKGMSMYGDTSAGLLVTCTVAGCVAGCLLTLLAQRTVKGKKKA